MGKKIIIVSFLSLLVFAGVLMISSGAETLELAQRSDSWPAASAVVERFEIRQLHRTASNASVEMAYSYQVGNEPYVGTRVCFGPPVTAMIPKRVSPGEEISIRYLPSDPAESVWIPGTTQRNIGLIAAGSVVALFGLILIVAVVRGRRSIC